MVGRTISHYQILEKLGEGGMGVVFKAEDSRLHRLVALKFLPPQLRDSQERIARLEQEARAISALNHPHIATIFDIDEAEGMKFLVLEYLPGGTLRSKMHLFAVSGRKLETEDFVWYARQIGDALAHAHRHGIIHRDVKPENVMFTAEGALKLTDFGLAKFRDSDELTRTGKILGTASYMSPEQAQGLEIDSRSDIFSFGVLLFELASGDLPFKGPHPAAIMNEVLSRPAPALGALRPDLPDPLPQIVARALRKDREQRYERVDDLLAELPPLTGVWRAGPTRDELTQPVSPAASAASRPAAFRPGARQVTLVAAAAVAVLFLIAAAVPSARQAIREYAPAWLGLARVPAERHLAVLPFQNVGGDPARQAFCDGLMETITSKLTQLEQFHGSLWVVPSSEIRAGGVLSPGRARRALGVNLALTGSVQHTGNGVRLSINLVDASTLRQLQAVTFDTSLADLSGLQDGIVARVESMLQLELQPQARQILAAGGTEVASAYDFYLQGRGYLQRYERLENLDSAIGKFGQALQQDPRFALAYAGLGEAYWRKFELTRDPQWVELARVNCRRAVEKNLPLAPVHVTLGVVASGTGQFSEAVAEFQRAIALDPASADAYRGLAKTYENVGRLADAEATYQKAIRLRPGYWGAYNDLGVFYSAHGRYQDAERQFRSVIDLSPDNDRGYSNLGGICYNLGRFEEAEALLRKSLAVNPTAQAYSNLGTLYFFQSRYADSVPMFEKATDLAQSDERLWGNLGDAYRATPGRAASAPSAYRRALQLAVEQLKINPSNADIHARIALYWAKLGDTPQALRRIREAARLGPDSVDVRYLSAAVYALAGSRDRALEELSAALAKGYSVDEARADPDLMALRGDARFERLTSASAPAQPNSGGKPN